MAFTQADIDTLKQALVDRKGVRAMTFGDRSYTFDSIDDIKKLLGEMETDVAAAANRPRTRYAATSKGV